MKHLINQIKNFFLSTFSSPQKPTDNTLHNSTILFPIVLIGDTEQINKVHKTLNTNNIKYKKNTSLISPTQPVLFTVSVIDGPTSQTLEAIQNYSPNTGNPIGLLLTQCRPDFDEELIQVLIAEMQALLHNCNIPQTEQITIFRDDDTDLQQKIETLYFFKK